MPADSLVGVAKELRVSVQSVQRWCRTQVGKTAEAGGCTRPHPRTCQAQLQAARSAGAGAGQGPGSRPLAGSDLNPVAHQDTDRPTVPKEPHSVRKGLDVAAHQQELPGASPPRASTPRGGRGRVRELSLAPRLTGEPELTAQVVWAAFTKVPTTRLGHLFATTALNLVRIDRRLTGTPLSGTRTCRLKTLTLTARPPEPRIPQQRPEGRSTAVPVEPLRRCSTPTASSRTRPVSATPPPPKPRPVAGAPPYSGVRRTHPAPHPRRGLDLLRTWQALTLDLPVHDPLGPPGIRLTASMTVTSRWSQADPSREQAHPRSIAVRGSTSSASR